MHPVRPETPRVTGFRNARPTHSAAQIDAIEWLADAHTAAERRLSADPAGFDGTTFRARLRKLLLRYGCSPDKIETRGHELDAGSRIGPEDAPIYDCAEHPDGAGSHARTVAYARIADSAIERLYEGEESAPRDLLHVTCTGYTSPSAAQRLVARRGWGGRTRVTHAYHMGCYASLPALRVASGLLAAAGDAGPRVDVVHTEVCTLHLHPADHSPEQLVVQSLFADGHIRYSVTREGGAAPVAGESLAVLALREEIVPESADAMAWYVSDRGMKMVLARDVPQRVAHVVREFVAAMFAEAGADFGAHRATATFAIHPGGPKVIDVLQQALELSDAQVAASRDVLRRHGNMSSATLPHIWMNLIAAGAPQDGSPLVSLAFGPGLTLSGALMVRC
jgi:predicted naringenin-chalcone synthase